MRTYFASVLLATANAVSLKDYGGDYYYNSYGGYNNGFVDHNYNPVGFSVGPPGSFNPAYGGYIYVDFPETDYDTHSEDRDSPSNSYDSFSDYFWSNGDSYNQLDGESEDSLRSEYLYSHRDGYDNPWNNHSISRDSASDFDNNSESGYSAHGKKHCFRVVEKGLAPGDGSAPAEFFYSVCYYSDSDDGYYHSDSQSSDSSHGRRGASRDSDSDSDDTHTTDDGSLGTTYDYSYDSHGSDYYGIKPDHYDFHPSGYDYYGPLDHYGFGATFGDLYFRDQLVYNL